MANNHLLIEEWLLSASDLAPEQSQQLQEHLKSCESCRQLAEAWREVEYQLKTSPMRSPEPGFTARWQRRFVEDHLRRQKWQAISIMAVGGGAALALLTALAIWLIPVVQNPLPYLMLWSYQLTTTFYTVSGVGGALGTVVRAILRLVPGTLWVALLVALGSLGVIWIVAFRKLTSPRRVIL
jgi:hypothetical protein